MSKGYIRFLKNPIMASLTLEVPTGGSGLQSAPLNMQPKVALVSFLATISHPAHVVELLYSYNHLDVF